MELEKEVPGLKFQDGIGFLKDHQSRGVQGRPSWHDGAQYYLWTDFLVALVMTVLLTLDS